MNLKNMRKNFVWSTDFAKLSIFNQNIWTKSPMANSVAYYTDFVETKQL